MLETVFVRGVSACAFLLVVVAAASAHAQPAHGTPAQLKDEIHYLGKVNVNEATAEELERIPGLSRADAQRILEARGRAPITNVKLLKLAPRVQRYLRTDGPSDFSRIKKLPLEIIESPAPTQTGDEPQLVSTNTVT